MDIFARALLIVERIRKDGVLGLAGKRIRQRYAGYRRGLGRKALAGDTTLEELEQWAGSLGEPPKTSGRQEELESILNDYLYSTRIE